MGRRDHQPRPAKKLEIKKQSLRHLRDVDLQQVAGGSRGRGTVNGQERTALC